MNKCQKTAAVYIASLKAIYFIHQQNHWVTNGVNFYGNHQLFQRLYESSLKDLDLAAEKFIGLFGSECLDLSVQNKLVYEILEKFKNESDPIQSSLKIELDFLKFSKYAYTCFEQEEELTLGLDDMIMAIASSREESVYLLKQALNN
ncbi:MAG: hypothetical protein LC122_12620 [Chitinophagales bacterium]|nr:hypothetical protein [Chitinophagales bacterium]